jgi:hypothetical protein
MLTLHERRSHNLSVICGRMPSTNPQKFFIEARDYKRSNSEERYYRSRWLLTLLRTYDCRCGMCGVDRDGLELDHFWIPKSKGGNFILTCADTSRRINNAVPLCMQCNRNKLDNEAVLTPDQAILISRANGKMTAMMNGLSAPSDSAEIIGYQPGDEMREHELGADAGCIHLKQAMRRFRRTGDNIEQLTAAVNEYVLAAERPKISVDLDYAISL